MPTENTSGSFYPTTGFSGVRSAEASAFGKVSRTWAPDSGTQGERTTTTDKLFGVATAGGLGTLAWYQGPKYFNQGLDKAGQAAQSIPFFTKKFANRVTAKAADWKISADSNMNFWYQFARKIETAAPFGNTYLSNIFQIFSKALYASETLSPFTKRQGQIAWDLNRKALGHQGFNDTLDVLERTFNLKRSDLQKFQGVILEDGNLFGATREWFGPQSKLVKNPSALLATNVAAMDKGRISTAYLTRMFPWLGNRDLITGEARSQNVFGHEGFVPVRKDLGYKGMLPTKWGMALESASNYLSMALQRTAFLMDELTGEGKDLLSFFSPQAKTALNRTTRKLGLAPHYRLGGATSMLGRYTKSALTVFAGLAVLNQAGFSLSRGDTVFEKAAGGVAQTAILAGAGGIAANRLWGKGKLGALIGGGLGVAGMLGLGPFSEGTIPGVAQLMGSANVIRSTVGEITMANKLRRFWDEQVPGSTGLVPSIGMGVTLGVAGTAAYRAKYRNELLTPSLRRDFLSHSGWGGSADDSLESLIDNVKGLDYLKVSEELKVTDEVAKALQQEVVGFASELRRDGKLAEYSNAYGKMGDTAIVKQRNLEQVLTSRAAEKTRNKFLSSSDNILKKLTGLIREATPIKAAVYASVLGTAAAFLATGSMGTVETADEIAQMNRGEKLKAVKRGQGWEFGQTPFEGKDILYYRPSYIARLASGATQAGSTGNRGMLEEFFLKNFSYKLEEEGYYTRPAPITSGAFDGIPFIYPLIKPIADLIKKPKLMHVEEWARVGQDGNLEYMTLDTGQDPLPNPELGGLAMPAPTSPYTYGRALGKSWTELSSVAGLVGFYGRSLMSVVTGSDSIDDQRRQLDSFSSNTDMVSRFYDLQTGGGFAGIPLISEPIRRFLVKPDVDKYNPLQNQMPGWMPSPFLFGNQYAGLLHGAGEYRLPGEGYAALHPELEGVDPEYYPAIHRFNILSDVAPWSTEFRKAKFSVERNIEEGLYDSEQIAFYYKSLANSKLKLDKMQYDSYVFDPTNYESTTRVVSEVNPMDLSFKLEGYEASFTLAGISNRAEDLIGQLNMSVREAARQRVANAKQFGSTLKPGMQVSVTTPVDVNSAVNEYGFIQASVNVGSDSLNQHMADAGEFAQVNDIIGRYAMTGDLSRTIGRARENILHTLPKIVSPAEHLGLFGAAPLAKTMNFRNVREEYEQSYLYGNDIKLWQKPLEHWFGAAAKSAAHNWLGVDFVSSNIQDYRSTDEYFDKLKYYKYMGLSQEARANDDLGMAQHYKRIASSTNIGGHGFIPERTFKGVVGGVEERYALGMAREANPIEKEKLLGLIPAHKRRLLASQYAEKDIQGLERLQMQGSITSLGVEYLESIRQLKRDEGYVREPGLNKQFRAEKQEGEEYADYMRRKEMEAYMKKYDMPPPNWAGYNPLIDTEDIKMKYIEQEGKDYHDYGLFKARQEMIHLKPYIGGELMSGLGINQGSLMHARNAIFTTTGIMNSTYGRLSYSLNSPQRGDSYIDIDLQQNHVFIPSEL